MELKTRRVHFAGCTTTPNEAWMKQAARELTNFEDGFLIGKRYLITDRDTKFCESFREILASEDIKPVLLPPRSPNLNSYLERFFGSLKSEALDRLILFGEKAMTNAVQEFLAHFHAERNHQGLENTIIDPGKEVGAAEGEVQSQSRLGGLLNYYYRAAA